MKILKRALFLVGSLLFGIFGVNVTASAATDYGSQFLTNVTLINNAGQNVLDSQIEVKDLEDYRLSYDFAYPNTVQPGDTMTVVLPQVLKVSQLSDFDIKNGDGVVVAKASFEEGTKKLQLTFTDRATEKQNNRGSFYISTKWDQTVSGVVDGPVNVELPVKGTVEKHTVLQKGVKYDASEFSKFGEMDSKNPTIINYELQLNYNGFNALMENIVGGDILGDGMDYDKNSFEFVMRKNGQSTVVAPSRYTVTFAPDNRSFGFKMDKVLPDEELFIRYKTKVTDGNKAAEYDNKAWIRYDANQVGLTVDKKTKNTVGGGSSTGEIVPPVNEPEQPDVTPNNNEISDSLTTTDKEKNGENTDVTPEGKTPEVIEENVVEESMMSTDDAMVENVVPENEPNVPQEVVNEETSKEENVVSEVNQLAENADGLKNTIDNVVSEKTPIINELPKQHGDSKTKGENTLPETGYNATIIESLLGLLLLGMTAGYVLYRKH